MSDLACGSMAAVLAGLLLCASFSFCSTQYTLDDSKGLGKKFDGIGAISGGGVNVKKTPNAQNKAFFSGNVSPLSRLLAQRNVRNDGLPLQTPFRRIASNSQSRNWRRFPKRRQEAPIFSCTTLLAIICCQRARKCLTCETQATRTTIEAMSGALWSKQRRYRTEAGTKELLESLFLF